MLSLTAFSMPVASVRENAPKPEADLASYDEPALVRRVEFGRQTVARKVSPRTDEFAQNYEAISSDTLDALRNDDISLNQKRAKLRSLDQAVHRDTSLMMVPKGNYKELMDNVQRLKRMEMLARYGDYLARDLNIFKKCAQKECKDDNVYLQEYWSVTAKQLKEEQRIEAQEGEHANPARLTTLIAVKNVCHHMGIDLDQLLWTIDAYSERNLAFHSGFDELLQRGKYSQAAKVLYVDIQDLERLYKDEEPARNLNYLGKILLQLRDRFFNVSSIEADNPEAWEWTSEAKQLRQSHANTTREAVKQSKSKS